jgi:hypothetical protein
VRRRGRPATHRVVVRVGDQTVLGIHEHPVEAPSGEDGLGDGRVGEAGGGSAGTSCRKEEAWRRRRHVREPEADTLLLLGEGVAQVGSFVHCDDDDGVVVQVNVRCKERDGLLRADKGRQATPPPARLPVPLTTTAQGHFSRFGSYGFGSGRKVGTSLHHAALCRPHHACSRCQQSPSGYVSLCICMGAAPVHSAVS